MGFEEGFGEWYGEFTWPHDKFCKLNFAREQREGKGEFKWTDGRI